LDQVTLQMPPKATKQSKCINLIRRDNQNVYYRQKWPNIFPSALHSQKLGYDFERRREKNAIECYSVQDIQLSAAMPSTRSTSKTINRLIN